MVVFSLGAFVHGIRFCNWTHSGPAVPARGPEAAGRRGVRGRPPRGAHIRCWRVSPVPPYFSALSSQHDFLNPRFHCLRHLSPRRRSHRNPSNDVKFLHPNVGGIALHQSRCAECC